MLAVPNLAVYRRGTLTAVASVAVAFVVGGAGAAVGAPAAGPEGTIVFASDRRGTASFPVPGPE